MTRYRWRCADCGAFGRISDNPRRDFTAHWMAEHYEAPK